MITQEFDNPEQKKVTQMIMDEMNKNPAERDKKIWESMSHPNKGIYDKIAQYPTMTSSKTIGISLSKEGVKWWNQKNRAEWYQYNDQFDSSVQPPNIFGQVWNDVGTEEPQGTDLGDIQLLKSALRLKNRFTEDELYHFNLPELTTSDYIKVGTKYYRPVPYNAPPACLWTNEYYVLNKENPGSAENPNALKKYIKNRTDHPKVPLYFPGGEAISACEKFRNAMFMGGILGDIDDANAGIDQDITVSNSTMERAKREYQDVYILTHGALVWG